MRWTVAAVVLAGCYAPAGETQCHVTCLDDICPGALECGGDHMCHAPGADDCSAQDAGTHDAPHDARPFDAPPGFLCYGSHEMVVCYPMAPGGTIMLSGTRVLHTDDTTGTDCVPVSATTGQPVCAIAAQSVMITGTIRAVGPKPLVIIATGGLTITGSLSVASDISPLAIAGAGTATSCAPGASNDQNGGTGGSHASLGGVGGASGQPSAIIGAPVVHPAPEAVIGGCAGAPGGGGTAAGAGGGAVFLISPVSLTIATGAVVDASGAGGDGGMVPTQGGGGAGAGGYIGIESLSPDVHGSLRAIGGGGGGGANGMTGGTAAQRITSCGAPGGTAGASAGNGGAGSTATVSPGSPGSPGVGAGGGGGGAGRIVIHGVKSIPGVACPAPMYLP